MTGSVCGYKVKANSFNRYLTACFGPDFVWVAGNLKRMSLAKDNYFTFQNLTVGNVFSPQFLKIVLITVTKAEFIWIQFSFVEHLCDAKPIFSTEGLHPSYRIHCLYPHRYYKLLRKAHYLDRLTIHIIYNLRPWVSG